MQKPGRLPLSDRAGAARDADLARPQIRLEADAVPREILPGLFGVRFPLPFVLDHVNIWLLADGVGWTVIDAGLGDERTRASWETLLAGFLQGRPITRVLATHFHPDHMGLAGWLCARTGADLWTSRTEWLTARMLAQDVSDSFVAAGRAFDRRAGLAEEQIEARARRGNLYRTRALVPPPAFVRVREGDRLRIDGDDWQVLVGRGHAPEMLCLYCAASKVLIAADQILPRISPNVGVWPSEPLANPLDDFLTSLAGFRVVSDGCVVLPSHGQPFHGLHGRIDQLIAHHEERLARTIEACAAPATVVEIIPALFDRQLDAHQLGFALGETLAHLNYLVAQDRIARRQDDDGRLRYLRR
jgi:glyoxylase-like metal-dependent hydrolase (beta-lactamase superfamily II)